MWDKRRIDKSLIEWTKLNNAKTTSQQTDEKYYDKIEVLSYNTSKLRKELLLLLWQNMNSTIVNHSQTVNT